MNGTSFLKKFMVVILLSTSSHAYAATTIDYIKLTLFTASVFGIGYAAHEAQDRYLPLILPLRTSFIKIVEIENSSDSAIHISSPAILNLSDLQTATIPIFHYSFTINANQRLKISNGIDANNPLQNYHPHIQKAICRSLIIPPHKQQSPFSIKTSLGWFHLFCDKEQGAVYTENSQNSQEEHHVSSLLNDLDASYQHHVKIIITEDGQLEVKLK